MAGSKRDAWAALQTRPGAEITDYAKRNGTSLVQAAKVLSQPTWDIAELSGEAAAKAEGTASSGQVVAGANTSSAKTVSNGRGSLSAETISSLPSYNDDSTYYVDNGALSTNVTETANNLSTDFSDIVNAIQGAVDSYNAKAVENAEAQWKYNSEEAQKSRDWQEYMSNTAHQREVADLIAAGLNPVLSAGGSGAAVSSGATASGSSASNSDALSSVFGNYFNTLINSATSIMNSNISAKSAENVAQIGAAANYKLKKDFPDSLGAYTTRLLDGFLTGYSGNSAKGMSESLGKGWRKIVDFISLLGK